MCSSSKGNTDDGSSSSNESDFEFAPARIDFDELEFYAREMDGLINEKVVEKINTDYEEKFQEKIRNSIRKSLFDKFEAKINRRAEKYPNHFKYCDNDSNDDIYAL